MDTAAFSFSTAAPKRSSRVPFPGAFGASAATKGFPPRATILSPSIVAWSNDSFDSSRKCSTIGFRVGPNTRNEKSRYFKAELSSIRTASFIVAITFSLSIELPGPRIAEGRKHFSQGAFVPKGGDRQALAGDRPAVMTHGRLGRGRSFDASRDRLRADRPCPSQAANSIAFAIASQSHAVFFALGVRWSRSPRAARRSTRYAA